MENLFDLEKGTKSFALNIQVASACFTNGITFIDNVNIFWNCRAHFKPEGIHTNITGCRLPAAKQHQVIRITYRILNVKMSLKASTHSTPPLLPLCSPSAPHHPRPSEDVFVPISDPTPRSPLFTTRTTTELVQTATLKLNRHHHSGLFQKLDRHHATTWFLSLSLFSHNQSGRDCSHCLHSDVALDDFMSFDWSWLSLSSSNCTNHKDTRQRSSLWLNNKSVHEMKKINQL